MSHNAMRMQYLLTHESAVEKLWGWPCRFREGAVKTVSF